MSPDKLNNEEGFTLIEVLISVTIFAVGILAVASMMLSSLKSNSKSGLMTVGTSLVNNKVEELLFLDYTDLDLVDDNNNGNAGFDQTVFPAADGNEVQGAYNLYWNIADNLPVADAKTVRVIATWTDRGSLKRYSVDFIKERE